MSEADPTATGLDEVLARDILPLYFGAGTSSTVPTFVLLSGQPGSGAARATGRLLAEHGDGMTAVNADGLRAFHPRFAELTASGSAEGARVLSEATAEWLRASIAFAREQHRSLLLEGNFATPSTAIALAQRFAAEGFRTRVVVVAARRAESLLASASSYLRDVHAGRPARFVSGDAHDRGFEGTRALTAAIEEADAIDRFTVLGRSGAPVFDAERDGSDRPFRGASAALRDAQSERLTSLQSAQWLSEYRRVTEFAATLRDLPIPLGELLIDLHETAIREVIRELPVPPGSRVIEAQEHRSAVGPCRVAEAAGAGAAHRCAGTRSGAAGPERGGPSR